VIGGAAVASTAPSAGAVSVSVGGVVSILKVTAALVPVFAGVALSDCVA